MFMKKRNIVVTLLIISMIVSCLFFEPMNLSKVKAAAKYNGRIINVVYDDSGSMVKNDSDPIERWSQAKYSLEVFAAMLGENDTMNVYPMSLSGGLGYTLTGKDSDRVNKIHEMNGRYGNTPFTTVTSAGQDLLSKDQDAERWLVIITDGAFDDGATPIEEVQSTIDSYVDEGIKVAYLAIGDDASILMDNKASGFYVEKAADGPDVLKKVTSIANQIFSHLILPNDYIEVSGDSYKLSFDIPVDQIIVFAQGDNVSIGDMSHDGEKIESTELENVKFSDVIPENYPDAIIDDSLKGVVASFVSGNAPYSEGDFEITVSGAETIEFYYKPGVVVNAELLYEGNPVLQDAELYAGDYDVQMNFINPLSGGQVSSKLLSDAIFSLDITNNEDVSTLSSDYGSISLVAGSVELLATAELPGQVILTDVKNYTVLPEPISLKLDFEKTKGAFNADEISEGKTNIILTVSEEISGELLSEEEWNSTEIKVQEGYGVSWKIERGEEVSTWILSPYSTDGTISNVEVGDTTFPVSAEYNIDGQYAYGSGELNLNILEYSSSKMILEVESADYEYTLKNLENEPGIVVIAYIEDENTNEKKIINEELWNNMTIMPNSKNKIDFKVEKGESVGKYILYPRYYKSDKKEFWFLLPGSQKRKSLRTDYGNIDVNIIGDTSSGEKRYHGETECKIKIKELSSLDKLIVLLPVILFLSVLTFIILGYVFKKRIPKKRLNPRCVLDGEVSNKKKVRKKILTVIIPYISEEARVNSSDTGFECYFPNLKIKAMSKRTFKILNSGIDVSTTLINGESFEDIKDIKKRRFSYNGFEITSVDGISEKGSFMFICNE